MNCSHAYANWTYADFLKLNNGLGKVVIQSKSPQKSSSFMRESISKFPGVMALFVGL